MRYTLNKLYEDIDKLNAELALIESIWRLQVKWYSDVSHLYYGTVQNIAENSNAGSLIHGTPKECLVRAEQFLLDEYRDRRRKQ